MLFSFLNVKYFYLVSFYNFSQLAQVIKCLASWLPISFLIQFLNISYFYFIMVYNFKQLASIVYSLVISTVIKLWKHFSTIWIIIGLFSFNSYLNLIFWGSLTWLENFYHYTLLNLFHDHEPFKEIWMDLGKHFLNSFSYLIHIDLLWSIICKLEFSRFTTPETYIIYIQYDIHNKLLWFFIYIFIYYRNWIYNSIKQFILTLKQLPNPKTLKKNFKKFIYILSIFVFFLLTLFLLKNSYGLVSELFIKQSVIFDTFYKNYISWLL